MGACCAKKDLPASPPSPDADATPGGEINLEITDNTNNARETDVPNSGDAEPMSGETEGDNNRGSSAQTDGTEGEGEGQKDSKGQASDSGLNTSVVMKENMKSVGDQGVDSDENNRESYEASTGGNGEEDEEPVRPSSANMVDIGAEGDGVGDVAGPKVKSILLPGGGDDNKV